MARSRFSKRELRRGRTGQFPNPYLWEKITTQFRLKASAFIPRIKFLNTSGYELKKVGKGIGGTRALNSDKGAGRRNSAGCVEFDRNQIQSRKLPLFAEMSKIREIIYCAELACLRRDFQQWRGMMMSSGWISVLDSGDIRRLTLLDLQNNDQVFRGEVFLASSQTRMTIEHAAQSTMLEPEFAAKSQPKIATPTIQIATHLKNYSK